MVSFDKLQYVIHVYVAFTLCHDEFCWGEGLLMTFKIILKSWSSAHFEKSKQKNNKNNKKQTFVEVAAL